MPQLRISDTFFKNERERAYADWGLAVWRELFQNSIDQHATRIDVRLSEADDNVVKLIFADNGPGMSRDVLERVYFSVGESTKSDDPTMIGGMGRARILTCFAMKSYSIYSQDYMVIGCREQYEVGDHPWTAGCRLGIEVDGSSLDTLRGKFFQFVSESSLAATVTLNGERVPRNLYHQGRYIRDLTTNDGTEFARVWVNKSSDRHSVIVRVNGVSMFTASANCAAQVIVELEPALSRKVLTATRDSLHWRYQGALNRFLAELAVDTTTALRSRFGRHTTVVRGGGWKVVEPSVKLRAMPRVSTIAAAADTLAPAALSTQAPDEPAHPDDRYRAVNAPAVDQFDRWLAATFGDIYVFDETENEAVRKVISAYTPTSWTENHVNGRTYRKGGNYIRVLLMWNTAIRYALEAAVTTMGLPNVAYAVGFTFHDQNLADHRQQDGGHIFCINPVDGDGKLKYSITNRRDLKRLMASAKHEVTHIAHSWHDENFCSARESIDAEFDEAECLRRMKEALKGLT